MTAEFCTFPEKEVLLHTISLAIGTKAAHDLETKLAQVTDWACLLQMAISQGVFPIFYQNIKPFCKGIATPEFLAEARKLYLLYSQRNLRMTAELLGIIALLESGGVAAIPFKGPTLALQAYGDVTLRQFVDLDILVLRQDIFKVKDLLVQAGYALTYHFSVKQELTHVKRTCELTFTHPQLPELDIHWRFAPDYFNNDFSVNEAFHHHTTLDLHGKTVFSLAPDDLLMYLCYHGTFHLWANLAMVSDVARLVQAQRSWDWAGLMGRSQSLGMRRVLLLGLSLAGELLAAPVPSEVEEEAKRDHAITTLKQQVLAKLFSGTTWDQGFTATAWFHLRAKERLQDRLRYISIRLAVPTIEDWQWVRLPDQCFGLYYLLRPLRLMMHGLVLPLIRRLRS